MKNDWKLSFKWPKNNWLTCLVTCLVTCLRCLHLGLIQTLNERDHLNVFNFTAIKQFFNAWSKSSWFKTRTRTSHGTVRVAPPLHQHTQSILILVYFSIQLLASSMGNGSLFWFRKIPQRQTIQNFQFSNFYANFPDFCSNNPIFENEAYLRFLL